MTDAPPPDRPPTPYELFGGSAFFVPLVATFYERVADDPILRPMYPRATSVPPSIA